MDSGSAQGRKDGAQNRFANVIDRFLGRSGSRAKLQPTVEMQAVQADVAKVHERDAIVGIATDPGCVRSANEDAVTVVRAVEGDDARGLLAVVCDGMGGHAAGEVASRIAIDTISKHWQSLDDPSEALRRALLLANEAIAAAAAADSTMAGMGTTCIALIMRGGKAWCAHVGDSRCYLLRNNELFLMTEDHSAVMDMVKRGQLSADAARVHPDKNVIIRALGARRKVDVTTWPRPFRVLPGDAFLLCSDGLYDVVSDDAMRDVLRAYPPQLACDRLVALAREHGAPDNVTVAVLAFARSSTDDPTDGVVRPTRESDVEGAHTA